MSPRSPIAKLILAAFGLCLPVVCIAQSTTQEFPTAVVSNEITGTIRARDLGDSRLTTFYYALNGDQGDLFINIVTKNLTGDIDVFVTNGLRPLTKIAVYADYGETETGRAVYLRTAEKLLLRIQGRSPNDDEATFKLKFAGSFVAARAEDQLVGPEVPKVNTEALGGIRVNTAGTIIPVPPKPVETAAEKEKAETEAVAKSDKPEEAKSPEDEKAEPSDEVKAADPSHKVIVSDPLKPEESAEKPTPKRTTAARRRTPVRRSQPKKPVEKPAAAEDSPDAATAETPKPPDAETPPFRTLLNNKKKVTPKKAAAEPKPDPLASINLVIQFKDGNTLEKMMSEVFKFSVDKGVLTVILKDGSISRYPIVDVAKVTIE